MAENFDVYNKDQQNIFKNMEKDGLRKRNKESPDNTYRSTSFNSNFEQVQSAPFFKNASEYARALRPWIQHYHHMNQMNNFHAMNMTMSCMNGFNFSSTSSPLGNNQTTSSPSSNIWSTPRAADPNRASDSTNNNINNNVNEAAEGGRLYRVPTFWRRVAAELIDFTLLFYIKLLVTLFVMKRFGHIYDVIDYQELMSLDEIDYDKAFAITTEVIAMEIINRLLITIFETMCLRHGIGTIGGATPGKRLLGLKLVSGHQITDRGNGLIWVQPATDVGWKGAFVRSAIKNFTIAFFLPACLTLFFHSYNRTIYDVVTKTIVVQKVDRHAEQ